jgi:hypothetical protein
MTINNQTKADFCLEIQFEKNSENPSRVFRTMTELIETMQFLDQALIKSIDIKIEPIMLLEDIESGSVKAWLAQLIKRMPDEALYQLDWKPIIGQYLVKGKRFIIKWCEGKTSITNTEQVSELRTELVTLARETNIRMLPDYQEITTRELITGIQRITENTAHLSKQDRASYYSADADRVDFNLDLYITPESIQTLLAKEIMKSESEMIVKVKKPDYLGESKWECKHGKFHIDLTIADKEWLKRFQNREILVQPQDSLRGRVLIENIYDENNELIDTYYTMVQVLDVISAQNPNQGQLKIE